MKLTFTRWVCWVGGFCAVFLGSVARAQSLSVSSAVPQYVAAGGSVTVLVEVRYGDKAPLGLGVELVLPAGWSYRATQGSALPEVGPEPGDSGSLGWAYVAMPAGAASFSVVLDYRGGLAGEQVLVARTIFRPMPEKVIAEQRVTFSPPPK